MPLSAIIISGFLHSNAKWENGKEEKNFEVMEGVLQNFCFYKAQLS